MGRLSGAPKIIQLLADLADPDNNELLRAFYAEPTGVMSNGPYNLTEGEQAIVQVPSATGIVVTYTPAPRPPLQNVVATF